MTRILRFFLRIRCMLVGHVYAERPRKVYVRRCKCCGEWFFGDADEPE